MSESQTKIKFPCPSCGREFTWKPEIAGKRAKCKCGEVLTVPKTRPVPDEPEPVEEDAFDMEGMGAGMEDDLAEPAAPPPPIPPPLASSGKRTDPKTAAAGKLGAALAGSAVTSKLNLGGGGDGDTWKWWYYVLGGLAMVPVAFYQYFRLLDYEKGEESSIGLKSFERMLYGIFGKWGVCGFIILIGAVCIAIGLHKYKKQREAAG